MFWDGSQAACVVLWLLLRRWPLSGSSGLGSGVLGLGVQVFLFKFLGAWFRVPGSGDEGLVSGIR